MAFRVGPTHHYTSYCYTLTNYKETDFVAKVEILFFKSRDEEYTVPQKANNF